MRTIIPGPPPMVRELRSTWSPLIPWRISMVASPIGRMLSVRNILSGSCRSTVTSPLSCRSPISR
jgi:hypothetical protein